MEARYTRLFTDEQGEACFEDVAIELREAISVQGIEALPSAPFLPARERFGLVRQPPGKGTHSTLLQGASSSWRLRVSIRSRPARVSLGVSRRVAWCWSRISPDGVTPRTPSLTGSHSVSHCPRKILPDGRRHPKDPDARYMIRTSDGRFARSSQNASRSKRANRSGGSTVFRGGARTAEPTVCSPGVPRRMSNSIAS